MLLGVAKCGRAAIATDIRAMGQFCTETTLGNTDDHSLRATLLERAAACSRSFANADDSDQRVLLENVRDMWKALADECWRLGDETLILLIGKIATLYADVLTKNGPAISRPEFGETSEQNL